MVFYMRKMDCRIGDMLGQVGSICIYGVVCSEYQDYILIITLYVDVYMYFYDGWNDYNEEYDIYIYIDVSCVFILI